MGFQAVAGRLLGWRVFACSVGALRAAACLGLRTGRRVSSIEMVMGVLAGPSVWSGAVSSGASPSSW